VTDDPTSQFLLSGAGGATIGIEGATKVQDLYTEVQLPLVQDAFMAKQLGMELAYRHSDYDPITTDTYKIGADWAPVEDVRFRASYQRAIRAANVVELFTAQGFNLFDMPRDPCGTGGTATRASCIASGVPAAVFDDPTQRARLNSPAGQYNFQQGGDPTLVPETSDTYTYGVVFQPSFLQGFTMSIDYFDIKIVDTISVIGADVSLNACLFAADAPSCARVKRDPTNGSLWRGDGHVIDLNTNIGSLSTKGWDLSLDYRLGLGGLGKLDLNLMGTRLDELVTDVGVGGTKPIDCAGKFSGTTCGAPNPVWRHHFRIGWTTPWDVDLGLTWRYYGSVTNIVPATQANIDYELGSRNYYDLSGTWAMTEKASLIAGINNVLDTDPPLSSAVGTTGNGNTYPQTYDALGRWIFIRAQIKF
jgi:outer membrane receptor protein involved in Fe transport